MSRHPLPRAGAQRVFAALFLFLALGAPRSDAQGPPPAIEAEAMRAHLAFLAHDLLEGRSPGTRGAAIAARYIASQLQSAGVNAPRGGYLQDVPIETWTPADSGNAMAFALRGRRIIVDWQEQVVAWPARPDSLVDISAELVFVGYGITAPEYRWDDYEGRDVRGRIALILAGEPPAPPTEPRLFAGRALTHHGRWSTKIEQARQRGAAGAIIIHSAASAGYPWPVIRSSFGSTRHMLPSAGDDAFRLAAWLRVTIVRELLDAAGVSFDELLVRAARRDFAPMSTGITASARLVGSIERIETHNVVGIVPGDERRAESVVYTAHYDHLGIGEVVNGDSIYNGAYDNASGVAALLSIARAFAQRGSPLPRSIVFVFTTAEEAGMLGAQHYVRAPALPLARTVAAINIDGANLWGETSDFSALGGDRSTLGRTAEVQGASLGMRAVPDPAPELGLYFRSDHLPFALAGVPAIQIVHGDDYRGRPAGWGVEMLARWSASSYHLPGDEYRPGFVLTGAVQQAHLAYLIGREVARAQDAPQWYEGGRPRVPAATSPSGDR